MISSEKAFAEACVPHAQYWVFVCHPSQWSQSDCGFSADSDFPAGFAFVVAEMLGPCSPLAKGPTSAGSRKLAHLHHVEAASRGSSRIPSSGAAAPAAPARQKMAPHSGNTLDFPSLHCAAIEAVPLHAVADGCLGFQNNKLLSGQT